MPMLLARLGMFLFVLMTISNTYANNQTIIPEVSLNGAPPPNTTNKPLEGLTMTLNQKKISKNPALSLTDLLKSQSIFRITNNSGDDSQKVLSIRGFGDNAVANSLILVDGFPLINSSLLAPNLNAILLSDIQTIHLFQGSQGSLWGNQAVGGVLDIDTRHPDKMFGNINLAYGSDDKQFLSGIFGDKLNNGFFYKILGFTTSTHNYRDHHHQEDKGLALQEGLEYPNGTITFNQKFYSDTIQFPGSLTESQFENNPKFATDTKDYTHYNTQIYQLLSKQEINQHWVLETRASKTNIESEGLFYSPFHSDEELNWINPQIIGTLNKNKITLGYSWQAGNYTNMSSQVQSRAHNSQNDIYGQVIIPFCPQWDLTLGSRSAWQSNFPQIIIGEPIHYVNHVFVTEQGLTYHVNHSLALFLRRDGNFRFPKTNEEVWIPTNVTELKPQTGVSYETGFTWKGEQQKTQLSFYELQLQHEIAYDPTQSPTQPFGATSNFDPTLRRGMTLTEEIYLTPILSINGQINYVDAYFNEGPNAGNNIPAVPALNGNAGIDYQFLPHWRTRYDEFFTGTSYASNDIQNIGNKSQAYWIATWSLQYFFKKVNINVEINNIFNQRHALFTVYNVYSHENRYYPGLGRNYTLSVKMSF
jgi:iron complex outermembrane receptor protein